MNVLTSLNTTIDGDSDERMTLNIQGTGKAIQIDLNKLKEAVKIIDNTIARGGSSGSSGPLEEIDINTVSE